MRAIQAGVAIENLFVRQSEGADVAAHWQDLLRAQETTILVASDRAFAKIAFGDRQEVVAVATTPHRSLDDVRLGDTACIAVLEAMEKPGNVGAILRSADGAGIDAVIIVDGGTDLFNPNAIRASLGTIFSQNVVATTFPEFAAWSAKQQLIHLLARLDGATDYTDIDYQRPVAIVLGSETAGLTAKWSQLPQQAVRIPMRGIADSLNVSAAAAILFYEARRASRGSRSEL